MKPGFPHPALLLLVPLHIALVVILPMGESPAVAQQLDERDLRGQTTRTVVLDDINLDIWCRRQREAMIATPSGAS